MSNLKTSLYLGIVAILFTGVIASAEIQPHVATYVVPAPQTIDVPLVTAPPTTEVPTTVAAPTTTTTMPAPTTTTTRAISPPTTAPPDLCAVALAYLAANAAPGFAHFCRPGFHLDPGGSPSQAYAISCYQGPRSVCPDGVSEIVVYAPQCPKGYMNEAANSTWPWVDWPGGIVEPGVVFEGHTWDPYGRGCAA